MILTEGKKEKKKKEIGEKFKGRQEQVDRKEEKKTQVRID